MKMFQAILRIAAPPHESIGFTTGAARLSTARHSLAVPEPESQPQALFSYTIVLDSRSTFH